MVADSKLKSRAVASMNYYCLRYVYEFLTVLLVGQFCIAKYSKVKKTKMKFKPTTENQRKNAFPKKLKMFL